MSALTLHGFTAPTVALAPDAEARREAVLKSARAIVSVSDAMDCAEAAAALHPLADLLKEVEAARKELKAPVNTLADLIQATAKKFAAPIEAEADRIGRLIGEHQAAQEQAAAEARRLAQVEANRAAAEASRAAFAARQIPHAQAEAKAELAEAKAELAAEAVALVKAPIARPDGITVRKKWCYEITDINALFGARPDLCLIVENAPAIRAQIPHNQTIPGLKIWQEIKAGTR